MCKILGRRVMLSESVCSVVLKCCAVNILIALRFYTAVSTLNRKAIESRYDTGCNCCTLNQYKKTRRLYLNHCHDSREAGFTAHLCWLMSCEPPEGGSRPLSWMPANGKMESHIHRSFNLFVLSWAGPLVRFSCLHSFSSSLSKKVRQRERERDIPPAQKWTVLICCQEFPFSCICWEVS